MADWEEVKRLAADLQKAQLSSTLQRLSERNCIEIVNSLIEQNLLNVIFSSDGKDYITPDELIREIKSELYVHGGRVNLVELAKALCVDLSQITQYAGEIQKNKNIHLILGQLIDNTYITRIAGEINEKLIQNGKVSVNDLTMQYDLPSNFLHHTVIEKQLGKLINAKQDPNDSRLFYTEAFAARTKAKIRGALSALTKPTPVTAILNQCGLQDSTFFMLFEQINAAGVITGRQAGAQFIPHVYSKSQADWVNSFYKQNQYLEFDALTRLGISDPKTYIKRQFPNEEFLTLNSCVVSPSLVHQVDGAVEECISSKFFVDIQTLLPSVFNDRDISMLIDHVLTPSKKKSIMILGNCVLSIAYIEILSVPCEKSCQELAKITVESGTYQQYQTEKHISSRTSSDLSFHESESKVDKREERRKKAAGGKTGGGTQGRETKTKSTKKHNRKNVASNDSDEEYISKKKDAILEIISIENVENIIQNQLDEDGIPDLSNDLAVYLQGNLNNKALEFAASIYASSTSNKASLRRQNHAALQEKLNALLGDVRLFEKGAKLFSDDMQSQLEKYLLKSLCTDIVNEILMYIASEYEMNTNNLSNPLTNEQRNKLVNDAPSECKTKLQALLKTLSGQSIEDFMSAAEDSLSLCSMILKKVDKKKDRLLILNHKHSLLDQLAQTNDPALVLHLCVLAIFATATQNMLHASGRYVTAVIMFLKQYLNQEQIAKLMNYHDLVTKYLSTNDSSEKEAIIEELNTKIDEIKDIANNFKKASSTSEK